MIGAFYIFLGIILSSISSRFIFGGDSAEFSAISHTWSVAHPPGYPLYSFLLNIITHVIPFGTIPWRASLLSVGPTVLTAYFLFKIVKKCKVRTSISLLSSVLYVFLFPVWEYTLVPEAFALNSLFVVSITYFLLRYRESNNSRYLFLFSLLIGLCVSHHHIFVIFIPGWIFLIREYLKKIVKRGRTLMGIIISFLVGFSFYLYAPIAGYFNPPIQWENAKTLLGFWRLITRAMYGSYTAYGGSGGNIQNQLYDVFSLFIFIFQDFRIIGIVFIGIGIWYTIRNKTIFFQFLCITSLVHVFFFFYTNFLLANTFSAGVYERFLITLYALLAIYFGIGFDFFYTRILHVVSRYSKKESIKYITRVCLFLIFIIYICTVAKTNFGTLSYFKNGADFDRVGKDIANTPPEGGIYYAGSDNTNFPVLYQVYVEKYNPKTIFFNMLFSQQKDYIDFFKKQNKSLLYPSSFHDKGSIEQFVKLNKKRGIYLENKASFGFWMPYGLLWKYYDTQEEGMADLPNIIKANTYLWTHVYHIPELNSSTRNLLHLQVLQDTYINAYLTYSKLLFYAKDTGRAREVVEQVLKLYKPSNLHARITLVNLLLVDKKCAEAAKAGKDIMTIPDSSILPELVPSLLNYYTLCEPSNKRIPILKRIMDTNNEKSLTPLDSF